MPETLGVKRMIHTVMKMLSKISIFEFLQNILQNLLFHVRVHLFHNESQADAPQLLSISTARR